MPPSPVSPGSPAAPPTCSLRSSTDPPNRAKSHSGHGRGCAADRTPPLHRLLQPRQDRRAAEPGRDVTVEGEIIDIREQFGGRPRVTARLTDGTGALTLIWFSTYHRQADLTKGTRIYASGTIRPGYGGGLEMVTPEWERADGRTLSTGRLAPVYPSPRASTRRTCGRSPATRSTPPGTSWWTGLPTPDPTCRQASTSSRSTRPTSACTTPTSWTRWRRRKRRLQFENLLLLQIGLLERKRRSKCSTGPGPYRRSRAARRSSRAPCRSRSPVPRTEAIDDILADDLRKPHANDPATPGRCWIRQNGRCCGDRPDRPRQRQADRHDGAHRAARRATHRRA